MAKKTKAKKSAKKPVKKAAKKTAKKAGKKTAKKSAPKKAAKKSAKKTAKKVVKKAAKKAKKVAKKTVKKVAKKAAPKKAKKVVKAVKKAVAKKTVKKVIKKAETPVVDAFKSAVNLAKKVVENVVAKVTDTEKHVDNTNENSGSESSHTENSSNNDTPSSKDEEEPRFVAHRTHLNAGDKAPYFEGRDQNGNILNSAMFRGKNLILYFYPQDDTETCTKEACNLRDEYKYLSDSNYAVVGVSPDDERSHTKFIAKYNLPFPLLADTDMTVIKAYDVWGTKKFMGRIYDGLLRTTFVIGPDGIIKEVITKVDSAKHAQQILGM